MSDQAKPMMETIDIAGKSIPMVCWGIAAQLSVVLDANTELTFKQKLALAINYGFEHAKKNQLPQFESSIRTAINDLDDVQQQLRLVLRNI